MNNSMNGNFDIKNNRYLAGQTFVSSITADVILSLITCGIYNLIVQHRQIQAVNHMLGYKKYSFALWLILLIVTCSIYHVYHQYVMASDINQMTGNKDPNLPLVVAVITIFFMGIVADALMQSRINEYYGSYQI